MITEKQVFAALPRSGFLRSYVEWGASRIGSSVAFHVPVGLTLLAQTVPITVAFPWNENLLRPNFYSLVVGPSSSSGKSRSIEAGRSILDEALPEAAMMTPGSPEACMDALQEKPQVLFFSEFGSFLQGTENGQLRPLRMLLTDLYDCTKIGRNLVAKPGRKPRVPVKNPRLSVIGGVTPGMLEDFTEPVDWADGFLARFFTIHSDTERRIFNTTRDKDARTALIADLAARAQIDTIFGTEVGECGGLTAEAQRGWEDWSESLRKRAKREDFAVRAAVHRAEGHCFKIATLLAWDYGSARAGGPWKVDWDILETAIKFTEFHISSVVEIAEGLAADRDMRDERRMYRAVDEEPIAYGEALKKAKLTKRRGDEMLASLLEKKMIYRVEDSDLTAPIRYARPRQSNVIPFRSKEGVDEAPSDPFS